MLCGMQQQQQQQQQQQVVRPASSAQPGWSRPYQAAV